MAVRMFFGGPVPVITRIRKNPELQQKIVHAIAFISTGCALSVHERMLKQYPRLKSMNSLLIKHGFEPVTSVERSVTPNGQPFFMSRNALSEILYLLLPDRKDIPAEQSLSSLMRSQTTDYKQHLQLAILYFCAEVARAVLPDNKNKSAETKALTQKLYGETMLSLEHELLNLSEISTVIYSIEQSKV